MAAKQTIHRKVTVTRTRTKTSKAKSSGSSNKGGNQSRCSKCGRYM